MKCHPGPAHHIWTAPALITIATLVCLIVALIAEGIWDRMAAGLLFAVLTYTTWLGFRSARSGN
ncbi:hypothetical protein FV218_19575 [Methylobacterium sp. WL69]|jgi:hypothetical protein|uniref:hypothetical protein n=1 Tax=Methylobacterium sp. WL69 TaxID=2603893 RepID=UPI0011C71E11|nr:hypothetical protein [Methylobacterium sp. WL69]TXM67199.1 hypothetical protein FV218_19575 [Methylobacterium sp. WL69]